MSEDQAVDAARKYLDELKGLLQWALGIALVATVLGVQGAKVYKVLGLELSRPEAFAILSLSYAGVCGAVLVCVSRLALLFDQVKTSLLRACFERLSHHATLFNPFARHALLPGGRTARHWGLVSMVVVFWLGLSSLFSILMEDRLLMFEFADLRAGASFTALATLKWAHFARAVLQTVLYLLPVGVILGLGYAVMLRLIELPRRAGRRAAGSLDTSVFTQLAMQFEHSVELGIGCGGICLLLTLVAGAWIYRA